MRSDVHFSQFTHEAKFTDNTTGLDQTLKLNSISQKEWKLGHASYWVISELSIYMTDDSRMVRMPISFMYTCIKFVIRRFSQFYNTQLLMFYRRRSRPSCNSKASHYIITSQRFDRILLTWACFPWSERDSTIRTQWRHVPFRKGRKCRQLKKYR